MINIDIFTNYILSFNKLKVLKDKISSDDIMDNNCSINSNHPYCKNNTLNKIDSCTYLKKILSHGIIKDYKINLSNLYIKIQYDFDTIIFFESLKS